MSSTEWDDVRSVALKRDGHECRFCGVSNDQHEAEHGRGLHAHHIVPESEGGYDDPSNLMMVCGGCHRTIESTQASALAGIKSRSDDEVRDELYPEVREELESEYTDTISQLTETVEDLEAESSGEAWVVSWLEDSCITVHTVVSSHPFGTHEIHTVTTDKEKAMDVYSDISDSRVTMESYEFGIKNILVDNLRVVSNQGTLLSLYHTTRSAHIDNAPDDYAVRELEEMPGRSREMPGLFPDY